MRTKILEELERVVAGDALEQQHIDETRRWIDSGAELIRTVKPATPPEHLVSYFAVVDDQHILLVDHKNAQLWLPSGGHVEPAEHPRTTVVRELAEELGLVVDTVHAPIMLTRSTTVGHTAGHTDVSFWYVIAGDRQQEIVFDTDEFHSVRWFSFDAAPVERVDPNLGRFISKLRARATLPEHVFHDEAVLVRSYISADEAGFVALLSNPEAMNPLSGPVPNPKSRFLSMLEAPRPQNGCWAIVDQAEGRYAGHVFVKPSTLTSGPELGFVLAPEFWGRGLARRAVPGLVDALRRRIPELPLVATVDTDNVRSHRVLKRAGFKLHAIEEDEEGPYNVFRLADDG